MALKGVAEAAEEFKAKREAAQSGGSGVKYFTLNDGDEVVVRFLEEGDEFKTYKVHPLGQVGNRWPKVPCLDQHDNGVDCPGCERGIKKSFRAAVNLIWRDGPVFERDDKGKIIKDGGKPVIDSLEDGVFVWDIGIEVAESLDHMDGKYKGLSSRDFEISRKGTKTETKYIILPADDQEPLSENDIKLVENKTDLNWFIKPPAYDDFDNYRVGGGKPSSDDSGDEPVAAKKSPFKRRNKSQ